MVGIRTAIEFIFPYWLIFYTTYFPSCHGHGRLIDPPSRASAWRYGFQTLPNYNDHELYCGGFTRQWRKNEGKCGECGDAWDLPVPRPHEYGGAWGKGVIVKRYLQGLQIPIRVELTASHMGYVKTKIILKPWSNSSIIVKYEINSFCVKKKILFRVLSNSRYFILNFGKPTIYNQRPQKPLQELVSSDFDKFKSVECHIGSTVLKFIKMILNS